MCGFMDCVWGWCGWCRIGLDVGDVCNGLVCVGFRMIWLCGFVVN